MRQHLFFLQFAQSPSFLAATCLLLETGRSSFTFELCSLNFRPEIGSVSKGFLTGWCCDSLTSSLVSTGTSRIHSETSLHIRQQIHLLIPSLFLHRSISALLTEFKAPAIKIWFCHLCKQSCWTSQGSFTCLTPFRHGDNSKIFTEMQTLGSMC